MRRDSLRWSVPWFITWTESPLHSPKTTGYAQLKLAIENLWLSVSPVNFGFLPTPAVVTFALVSPWLAHAQLSCPFGRAGRDLKCCSRTHVFLSGQTCSRLKLSREMGSGVYLHQSSRHWTDYQPGMGCVPLLRLCNSNCSQRIETPLPADHADFTIILHSAKMVRVKIARQQNPWTVGPQPPSRHTHIQMGNEPTTNQP